MMNKFNACRMLYVACLFYVFILSFSFIIIKIFSNVMVFLIFPHQLYYNTLHLKSEEIFLIEEPRYFTEFKFHKLKIAYHRASMKKYYDYIRKKNKTTYVDFNNATDKFYKELNNNYQTIIIINVADHKLLYKLKSIFDNKLVILENKNFLIKTNEIPIIKELIFKNNKYSHEEFYKYQRRKLNILIDSNKPIGNKWSFDTENRLPLPKNHIIPKMKIKKLNNKYIIQAIKYVNKYFSNNYGSLENFIYPIDNKGAKKWLNKFLKERLHNFGLYEDAVNDSEPFIYHSVLSPMMNIGIITDIEIVNTSYKFYLKNKKNISIQSFEGFIRQIIGWRNYVYIIYLLEGEKMYESNYLNHHNKLNYEKFWTGKTNIIPIDSIINKMIKYSYAHHIERLMYLGNFMLLCMIDPKDVYKIFMEWTIDAYDVFMVPNVFGMSQFASNIMMTRPYFSSSNYIIKMSNYKRNNEWNVIWDALYYNFIDKHKHIFKKIYAVAMQVKYLDKKTDSEMKEIKRIANKYLDFITS